MTKIAHIALEMGFGGAQQVIYQICKNADKEKYEHIVICLDGYIGEIGEKLANEGFKLITLNRRPGFDFTLLRQLRSCLLDNNVDIIHCHQYTPYSYGVLAALFEKIDIIFTEHGRFYPDSYKWKRYLINPFLQLRTQEIVSICEATKDALIKYENFSRSKIQVIYNGLKRSSEGLSSSSVRDEYHISDQTLLFGTVSRLDKIKNQGMMIRAFNNFQERHSDSRLMIVGDGPCLNFLENLCKELDISEKVIFTGFKKNTSAFYSAFDVFLLSSLSEGASMSILEAMSYGTASIVTDAGGNAELIKHLDTGLVTPNQDQQHFLEAMVTLAVDENLRTRLAQNAVKRFNEKFEIKHMINDYEKLYALYSDN